MSSATLDSAEVLGPYVPRLTIRWIAEQPHATFRTLDGSMLFVDISGFTKMSERLARHGKVGAEEVTDVLGAIFAKLLAVAYGEDGSLLKFGGDALLLWFSGDHHAMRAAWSAHSMRATLRSVGRLETTAGKVLLRMSSGVHSGSFHFFLVGDSHRELVVTGPAASRTVEMEGTATAGEILISRETAAALPEKVLGKPKGDGVLLRSGPGGVSIDRDDSDVPLSGIDITKCIPAALQEHLRSGEIDPEHRNAAIAFVHFDEVDGLLADRGADVVAAGLHELIAVVQQYAEQNGVTFLGTDIDHDGGKVILVAGAPSALGDDEGRMLLTLRSIVDAGTELPVRIGVNRGNVFAGDVGPSYRRTYTVIGDAVNLAARVMSMAVPGQILATGPVLDASSVAFNAVALEPFMVKGKKDPVHASMVGHSTGSKQETALREFPLVGRDTEMDVFRRALVDLRAGRGSLVEVVGNAGMGKTRLLSEFRSEAPDLPQLVASCELYESSVAYLPIRRLLRLLLGSAAGEEPSAVGERLREDVARRAPDLLPWLPLLAIVADVEVPPTPEVADLDGEFRKSKLEDVTIDYLSRVVSQPTLVVIEDAHWMDEASADLLRAVALGITELPWLICISRRDETTGFVLPDAPRCGSLPLSPLSSDALGELIAAATEEDPFLPHEVDELSDRSGGNPLFLQELVQAARSVGSVEGLPDSIQGIVMADIDRLTVSDRTNLRYASVLGMSFDADLVRALFEGEDELDGRTWDRLVQFIDNEGGGHYRFRHALMRDAAYEGLPYRRRRQLHQRVGNAILRASGTDHGEHAELLSMHFFLAGDDDQAFQYSEIAAKRAEAAYANIEASRFYQRAIDAGRRLPHLGAVKLAVVYEALGDVLSVSGEYRHAADAYDTARRLHAGHVVSQAALVLKRARAEDRLGRFSQALAWLTRGRRLLEGSPEGEAAKMRARLSAWYGTILQSEGRYPDARRWCRRALEEAEAVDDREALAQTYNALFFIAVATGDPVEPYLVPALRLYRELGDLVGESKILHNLGVGAYFAGRWDEALGYFGQSKEASLRIGDAVGAATTADSIGEVLSDQGLLDEAEAQLRDSLPIWKAAGDVFARGNCLRVLGTTVLRLGRPEECLALLDESRAAFVGLSAHAEVASTDARIAECRAAMGKSNAALELAEETLSRVRSSDGVSPDAPLLQRVRGYALAQLGDLEGAKAGFEESLRAGRARGADHEVALTLHAIVRVALIEDEPVDPEVDTEIRSLLERLHIVAVPVVPLFAYEASRT